MITRGINFKNFKIKKSSHLVKKNLNELLKEKNEIIHSLKKNYRNSFDSNFIKKYRKYSNLRLIGIGGSSLGFKSIYYFLSHKIKKKIIFIDDLIHNRLNKKNKRNLNLIVSKSGNTIETIINANIIIKKKDKNIFLTEKKNKLFKFVSKKA